MAHLGENLASKGYVVASIDHLDSTYDDRQPFQSTLYNRPLDQRFVIDQIATATGPASFLGNSVDGENTAVIGYSMGGYGLVNNLGAGFNDDIVDSPFAPPNRLLSHHASGNPEYRPELDSRIKAGVAIAPWGMTSGIWRPEDLHAIKAPTLYVAGSLDRTAGYEDGVRAMFENAINSDRYLLTFVNAGHNAAAPMPVPVEILHGEDQTGSNHYTDPVWDTLRMNNILAHFVTAFLDHHLKQKPESRAYLDLLPNANDGVYSVDEDEPTSKHTYWKGFGQGTAHGLLLEHLPPGQ
jgi:predicted dienelactone hydrolase